MGDKVSTVCIGALFSVIITWVSVYCIEHNSVYSNCGKVTYHGLCVRLHSDSVFDYHPCCYLFANNPCGANTSHYMYKENISPLERVYRYIHFYLYISEYIYLCLPIYLCISLSIYVCVYHLNKTICKRETEL
jgi:hypothetical protein